MSFSTQRKFQKMKFPFDDSGELSKSPHNIVAKSYESSTDTRAWSLDETERSQFYLECLNQSPTRDKIGDNQGGLSSYSAPRSSIITSDLPTKHLTSEIENLKRELSKKTKDIANYESRLKELNGLVDENKNLQSLNEKLNKQIAELERNLKLYKSQNLDNKDETTKSKQTEGNDDFVKKLNAKIFELTTANEKLLNDLNKIKSDVENKGTCDPKAFEELKATNEQLLKDDAEYKKKYDNLNREYENLITKMTELGKCNPNEFEELKKANEQLSKDQTDFRTAYSDLKEKYDKFVKEMNEKANCDPKAIDELKAANTKLLKEINEKVACGPQEFENLNAEYEQVLKNNAELKDTLNELKENNDNLLKQLNVKREFAPIREEEQTILDGSCNHYDYDELKEKNKSLSIEIETLKNEAPSKITVIDEDLNQKYENLLEESKKSKVCDHNDYDELKKNYNQLLKEKNNVCDHTDYDQLKQNYELLLKESQNKTKCPQCTCLEERALAVAPASFCERCEELRQERDLLKCKLSVVLSEMTTLANIIDETEQMRHELCIYRCKCNEMIKREMELLQIQQHMEFNLDELKKKLLCAENNCYKLQSELELANRNLEYLSQVHPPQADGNAKKLETALDTHQVQAQVQSTDVKEDHVNVDENVLDQETTKYGTITENVMNSVEVIALLPSSQAPQPQQLFKSMDEELYLIQKLHKNIKKLNHINSQVDVQIQNESNQSLELLDYVKLSLEELENFSKIYFNIKIENINDEYRETPSKHSSSSTCSSSENEDDELDISKLQQKISFLNNQILEKNCEISNLRHRLDLEAFELENARNDLSISKCEIVELNKQIKCLKRNLECERENSCASGDASHLELIKKQKFITCLEHEVHSRDSQISQLNDELNKLQQKLCDKKCECEHLHDEIKKTEVTLEKLHECLDELNNKYEEANICKNLQNSKLKSYKEQSESLEKLLELRNCEIKNLKGSNELLNCEILKLHAEIKALNKNICGMSRTKFQMTGCCSKDKMIEIYQENCCLKEEICRLRNELSQIAEIITDLEEEKDRNINLLNKLDQVQGSIMKLYKPVNVSETCNFELKSIFDKIDQLTSELDCICQENQKLQNENESLNSQVDELGILRTQLSESQARLHLYDATNSEKILLIEKLKTEIITLSGPRDELKTEIQQLKHENDRLKSDLNLANCKINQMEKIGVTGVQIQSDSKKSATFELRYQDSNYESELRTFKESHEEIIRSMQSLHELQVDDIRKDYEMVISSLKLQNEQLRQSMFLNRKHSENASTSCGNKHLDDNHCCNDDDEEQYSGRKTKKTECPKLENLCQKILNDGIENLTYNELCFLHKQIYTTALRLQYTQFLPKNLVNMKKLQMSKRINLVERELKESKLILENLKKIKKFDHIQQQQQQLQNQLQKKRKTLVPSASAPPPTRNTSSKCIPNNKKRKTSSGIMKI